MLHELTDREVHTLRAHADDLPYLHAFANGLERDHAAALNGLTLRYSSGAVEGKVSGDVFRDCSGNNDR